VCFIVDSKRTNARKHTEKKAVFWKSKIKTSFFCSFISICRNLFIVLLRVDSNNNYQRISCSVFYHHSKLEFWIRTVKKYTANNHFVFQSIQLKRWNIIVFHQIHISIDTIIDIFVEIFVKSKERTDREKSKSMKREMMLVMLSIWNDHNRWKC
jgi:hypothetical protein